MRHQVHAPGSSSLCCGSWPTTCGPTATGHAVALTSRTRVPTGQSTFAQQPAAQTRRDYRTVVLDRPGEADRSAATSSSTTTISTTFGQLTADCPDATCEALGPETASLRLPSLRLPRLGRRAVTGSCTRQFGAQQNAAALKPRRYEGLPFRVSFRACTAPDQPPTEASVCTSPGVSSTLRFSAGSHQVGQSRDTRARAVIRRCNPRPAPKRDLRGRKP